MTASVRRPRRDGAEPGRSPLHPPLPKYVTDANSCQNYEIVGRSRPIYTATYEWLLTVAAIPKHAGLPPPRYKFYLTPYL